MYLSSLIFLFYVKDKFAPVSRDSQKLKLKTDVLTLYHNINFRQFLSLRKIGFFI